MKSKNPRDHFNIVLFDDSISLDDFDCGVPDLNRYLKEHGKFNHEKFLGRLYCALDLESEALAGFFVISMAQIQSTEVSQKHKKQFPRYPIPAGRIGRLAVSKDFQKRGLGELLLMSALKIIRDQSHFIGAVFCIVDAKDKKAESFYKQYGFEELKSATDESFPKPLFLPAEVLRSL